MTQKEALDILKTGRSVFLTGAAGSGKTHVLREYIAYLQEREVPLGITASTGIAATHMGGTTIHSWAGIGIKDYLSQSEIAEIAGKQHVKHRVRNARVLIIDEVSMLHHFRLDIVDAVLREVKNCPELFGGVQVIFCGDFFQLPPITRGEGRESGERGSFFAYHSDSWKNLDLKVCYLSEQHRQNDLEYLKVLNAIRDSAVSPEILEILKSRLGKKAKEKSVEATRLYSHNRDVDAENEMELGNIIGSAHEYEMQTRGKGPLVETLKKSCLAPETLRLKVGAKVMFVKNNFDAGYVNGTLGTVEYCGFEEIRVRTIGGMLIDVERESWQIEEDGKLKAEINQFPLRLAWAITVHKSQGMSLDAAEVNLSDSFERGMGYVALSRVRSLDGLYLQGFNDMALQVNSEVAQMDRKFRQMSEQNSFHIRTMGEKKLGEMHDEFISKAVGKKSKPKKLDTVAETKQMLEQGMSLKEIAKERGLKVGTIMDHLEEIKLEDPTFNIYNLQNGIPRTRFKTIYSAFRKVGIDETGKRRLGPVKELLGPKFSYDDLRLVRLFL